MNPRHPFAKTCDQILREELPNLLRLYVNPHVTQACFCLERYVQATWRDDRGHYQTFLANGFDEALSGAIKLARFTASRAGGSTAGLIVDGGDRLEPFAGVSLAGGDRIEFVPGLTIVGRHEGDARAADQSGVRFGFVVLVPAPDGTLPLHADPVGHIVRRDNPLVIVCVERASLAALRRDPSGFLRELTPDVVVFDESFVNGDVPFGAFTARQTLYHPWNHPGKTTFHSTTFQPNTIASLHFLRCLEKEDPEFHGTVAYDLERIQADLAFRGALFQRLYSPSLRKATRSAGFDAPRVRAAGAYVFVGERRVFDGVSGVACSVRGHNPPEYVREMEAMNDHPDIPGEVATRLRDLTGLECMVPAVSGASAVESALKIGLAVQFPRRHILALKQGFGGKTLLALAGTYDASYKEHIDPLYPHVVYVDPFAPDAMGQIEAALAAQPVAVVQVELIQAVGGVRRVPEAVLRHLQARRSDAGYLLLIDEVQTGVHRTGPFALSRAMGLAPDLLAIGKGTSDMMFPFALVLYSAEVQRRLDAVCPELPAALRERYGYDFGYRTVLNVLRQAADLRLAERVAEAGIQFDRHFKDALGTCKAVRAVRTCGLLIGIELETDGWVRRWLRKRLYLLYILGMLRHPRFPVLVGYCQYEPNVLKFTPPLTVAPEEIRQAAATMAEVLRRPSWRLLTTALSVLMGSFRPWRQAHDHGKRAVGAALDPVHR